MSAGPPMVKDNMPDEQAEKAFLKEHLTWWDTAVLKLWERMKQYD